MATGGAGFIGSKMARGECHQVIWGFENRNRR